MEEQGDNILLLTSVPGRKVAKAAWVELLMQTAASYQICAFCAVSDMMRSAVIPPMNTVIICVKPDRLGSRFLHSNTSTRGPR